MELESVVIAEFEAASRAMADLASDSGAARELAALAGECISALKAGGKVVFAGNGGSFAQAQHLAAELVGRFRTDRPPIASLALGSNGPALTAISNDYGYEDAIVREAAVLVSPEDVLVLLTTSGNSANVCEVARRHVAAGGRAAAWTGSSGGTIAEVCPAIRAPATDTARIQEIHLVFGHTLCHLIERGLAE
ncbi:MAG: SIS domain-containing protein [Rhodothermales bacterium]|nr:SIS domain-containing protein [Rhodothermales bacterium]